MIYIIRSYLGEYEGSIAKIFLQRIEPTPTIGPIINPKLLKKLIRLHNMRTLPHNFLHHVPHKLEVDREEDISSPPLHQVRPIIFLISTSLSFIRDNGCIFARDIGYQTVEI